MCVRACVCLCVCVCVLTAPQPRRQRYQSRVSSFTSEMIILSLPVDSVVHVIVSHMCQATVSVGDCGQSMLLCLLFCV